MDLVTWINTFVGIIGIIVGIIGLKNINDAKRINNNNISMKDNASFQKANVIHNGLDGCEVVELSEETTKTIISGVVEKLETEIATKQSKILSGTELPAEGLKEGEIFFLYE